MGSDALLTAISVKALGGADFLGCAGAAVYQKAQLWMLSESLQDGHTAARRQILQAGKDDRYGCQLRVYASAVHNVQ